MLFTDDTSPLYYHKDLNTITDVLNEELCICLVLIQIDIEIDKLFVSIQKSCLTFNPTHKIEIEYLYILPWHISWWVYFLGTSYLANNQKVAQNIGILGEKKLPDRHWHCYYIILCNVYPCLNYCNFTWASSFQARLNSIYHLHKRTITMYAHQRPLFFSVYQMNHLGLLYLNGLPIK